MRLPDMSSEMFRRN